MTPDAGPAKDGTAKREAAKEPAQRAATRAPAGEPAKVADAQAQSAEAPLPVNGWSPLSRTVLMLGVLFGLALALRATQSIAGPILLGLVIAVGAAPLIGGLVKRRVPPIIAYMIALLVIGVAILAGLGLMSFLVFQLTDLLPQIQDDISALEEDVVGWLAGWGFDLSGVLERQILSPENVVGWVSAALEAIYNALKNVSLIVFIVAYMLVEVSGFRARFYQALGEDRPALRRWILWSKDTRTYLWITTVLAFVVAVLNFFLLLALGVPLPLTWAFLSFIMSYVPSVGFLIALLPPVALAILDRAWWVAGGIFFGYVIINFISDNIFKPRVLKAGMDLPAVVGFLSVLVWGFILGPIGALLSVPMTMLVRTIFLESSPSTEQLGLLLRSGPPLARTKKQHFWWLRRTRAKEPPAET